jgi:hypothetical protein
LKDLNPSQKSSSSEILHIRIMNFEHKNISNCRSLGEKNIGTDFPNISFRKLRFYSYRQIYTVYFEFADTTCIFIYKANKAKQILLTERGLHGGKAVKENSAIFQSYSKTL